MPRKLKRRQVGKASCTKVKLPNRKPVTLCVMARKYGYMGWLQFGAGKTLPVPTGKARSLKSAKSAAKKFLRRAALRK